ncbi:hypothetical protein FGO68_gene8139 [Halteria grandinella]|uniref:Secreted protein n=1 Tax=Halteria grandinella TaxID=5974 RepID=A0A8J8NV63_HALGN|nr:hypothetical protein FGO68_gene8139 [Halteria grandinella]
MSLTLLSICLHLSLMVLSISTFSPSNHSLSIRLNSMGSNFSIRYSSSRLYSASLVSNPYNASFVLSFSLCSPALLSLSSCIILTILCCSSIHSYCTRCICSASSCLCSKMSLYALLRAACADSALTQSLPISCLWPFASTER